MAVARSAQELPLEVEQRLRALWSLYESNANYYELLGLSRDADRKALKRAYYELAAVVHPDRHASRVLGDWKPRMEALFRQLTTAHDILADPEQRASYDRTLPPINREALISAPDLSQYVLALRSSQGTQPSAVPYTPSDHPSSPPVSSTRPAKLTVDTPAPISTQTLRTEAQRREALARRLLGGARNGLSTPPSPFSPLPPPSASIAPAAPEEPISLEGLLRLAQEHSVKGDSINAARTWARAAKLAPDDFSIKQRAVRTLLGQAAPDLHAAAELAKLAIREHRSEPEAHVLLAEVYLAAQLPAAARSVLEHAWQVGLRSAELERLLRLVSKKK